MHWQQHGRHGGMQVRIDEAGYDHVVGETFVHGVLVSIQPGFHGCERAHLYDSVAAYRHRLCARQGRIHRDNRAGEVNGQQWRVLVLGYENMPDYEQVVERVLIGRCLTKPLGST